MTLYTCYLIDKSSRIVLSKALECQGDEDAVAMGREHLKAHAEAHGAEIWLGRRRLVRRLEP